MGKLVLETVTCVTVASYHEPRPSEGSPLAALTKTGVNETHKAREEIGTLMNEGELSVEPIDAVFAALPLPMVGVAVEMAILLTGDERTGFAELPFQNHALLLDEVDGARKVESSNPTSLLLVYQNPNRENSSFLREYGVARRESLLDFAEIQEAYHVLLLGLPIFLQAIAHAFAKGEDEKRMVVATAPRNGMVMKIELQGGRVILPGMQRVR